MGIALIAMAEPLGAQMAGRALEHLLQYGEPAVRRAVPLALAILHASSPDLLAMDTLSRLSHDQVCVCVEEGGRGQGTGYGRRPQLLPCCALVQAYAEVLRLYIYRKSLCTYMHV